VLAPEDLSVDAETKASIAWVEDHDTAFDAAGIALIHEVWKPIMTLHSPQVWRRMARSQVHKDDVKDIYQEVWLTLYRRVATTGVKESLGKMVGQIAKGKVLDYARARGRGRKTESMPESGSALPESLPDIVRAVDLRTLTTMLMRELPEQYKGVTTKRILEDKSQEEAAAELNLTVATVKSRYLAALRWLSDRAKAWLPPSQQGGGA
jgi:RNA polymerase sigma-70 factor (ECF subfamily)